MLGFRVKLRGNGGCDNGEAARCPQASAHLSGAHLWAYCSVNLRMTSRFFDSTAVSVDAKEVEVSAGDSEAEAGMLSWTAPSQSRPPTPTTRNFRVGCCGTSRPLKCNPAFTAREAKQTRLRPSWHRLADAPAVAQTRVAVRRLAARGATGRDARSEALLSLIVCMLARVRRAAAPDGSGKRAANGRTGRAGALLGRWQDAGRKCRRRRTGRD